MPLIGEHLKSPDRMRWRLAYLTEAKRVIWAWIREGDNRESELSIRLMYTADAFKPSGERTVLEYTEYLNEATRLIRDVYLTDRKPASIIEALEERRKKAQEKADEASRKPDTKTKGRENDSGRP